MICYIKKEVRVRIQGTSARTVITRLYGKLWDNEEEERPKKTKE